MAVEPPAQLIDVKSADRLIRAINRNAAATLAAALISAAGRTCSPYEAANLTNLIKHCFDGDQNSGRYKLLLEEAQKTFV